ncbi:MraY family glycosyltransferase [uncultured Acetobacteroides sp.]|uniref:MraY family glycosyltransferase n=1 Tax=uncultured Acetobacteroides sp. TaxID=1760811 RepID=UPI0029F4A1C3|nr:MraY family glycosyltransferase [uncultured Acetobacteroides sp.]
MDKTVVINLLICLTFAISAAIGFIIVPRIVIISRRKGLFDFINERKVHTKQVPRLGGVSFLPALLFSVSFVMGIRYLVGIEVADNISHNVLVETLFLLCSLVVLFFIGLADDLISVSFRYKLLSQVLVAVLMIASGVYVDNMHGFFGMHEIPNWVGYILTVILVCFVINAINLIDGVDGLASGLSSIALASLGVWFLEQHLFVYSMLAFAMLGVIIPFFIYNVFGGKNKIFMGDTGSLLIGYLIAFLSAKLCMISVSGPVFEFRGAPIFIFAILFIPLFDAARVFVERMRAGKSPFYPDKTHIHHKFLALGFSHRQTMVSIVLVEVVVIVVDIILSQYLDITLMFFANIVLGVFMMVVLHRIQSKFDDSEEVEHLKEFNTMSVEKVKNRI